MKKWLFTLCLLSMSIFASARIPRMFFGCTFGDNSSSAKSIIKSQFADAIDNGESVSFPHGKLEYVTMYFVNNIFYKIEFTSADFSPKFKYFDYEAEHSIGRYAEYGIKDVEKPSHALRPTDIFMKGKEVSDGITDCCLYLSFSVDGITQDTTFKNHLIYVESKLYKDNK